MKKVLSLVLVLTLVLGSFSFAFAAEPTDNEKVNVLIDLGLVLGDAGGYRLNDTITRAEAAVMVVNALDLGSVAQASKYPSSFSDLPANHWALGYVNVAAGRGIVNGYPDGTFRPDANISYAEIITMMVQILGGLNEQEAKAPWPANMITKASELGVLEDVEIANFAELAIREKVFELVYNTRFSEKTGVYQIVKAIVLENYRVESIGKSDIVVEVIKEVQKANFVTESREKGDQIKVELPAKLGDVENLLGKVVDLSFDKTGKVVKIEIDDSYEYLTGSIDADENYIELNSEDEYTVRLEERYSNADERMFRTYYNNEAMSYKKFFETHGGAEYARVTVKNGKVLFIDAFQFTDIAPVQEVKKDGSELFLYDDNSNGSLKKITVASNARIIEVDVENDTLLVADKSIFDEEQVVHYIAGSNNVASTIFVRTDAKLTGVYEKARSTAIDNLALIDLYVDGDAYTALTGSAYASRKAVYTGNKVDFNTLEGSAAKINETLAPYKDKDVVILLDMNDNVQYLEAEVGVSHFIGLIKKIVGTQVQILKSNGETENYTVTLDSTLRSLAGGSSQEAELNEFTIGGLVRVSLDDDSNVATMVEMSNNDLLVPWTITGTGAGDVARKAVGQKLVSGILDKNSNARKITVGSDDLFVTNNTIVFINTATERKVTTIADVLEKYHLEDVATTTTDETPEAYVVYDENGTEKISKVIVFTNLVSKSAATKTEVVKFVSHDSVGKTYYANVIDSKGNSVTLKFAGVSAEKLNLDALRRHDVFTATVDKADATVLREVYKEIDYATDAVYEVKEVLENGSKVKLSDGKVYWFSYDVAKFGTITVGAHVQVKTTGNMIDIISVVTKDVTVTTGGGQTQIGKEVVAITPSSITVDIDGNGTLKMYATTIDFTGLINVGNFITYTVVPGQFGQETLINPVVQ